MKLRNYMKGLKIYWLAGHYSVIISLKDSLLTEDITKVPIIFAPLLWTLAKIGDLNIEKLLSSLPGSTQLSYGYSTPQKVKSKSLWSSSSVFKHGANKMESLMFTSEFIWNDIPWGKACQVQFVNLCGL